MRTFDTDNAAHRAALLEKTPMVEVFARRTVYGAAPGLVPFSEDQPDKLVAPADYKEVIAHCHDAQVFPLYHQRATWAPQGFQWTQDGLSYCWTWAATAALMDVMAREGKHVKLLSPVTLGWLVNWRNSGNYLSEAIRGLKERGVAEMTYTPNMHSRAESTYRDGWEENAMGNRLAEVWDGDNSTEAKTIQMMVSLLSCAASVQSAYNWWGHSVSIVGLRWDESLTNNMAVIIRNSHNEDDVIELTGSRAVPDELYGFRASLTQR